MPAGTQVQGGINNGADLPDTRVHDWRRDACLDAGLTFEECEVFADGDGDLAMLRKLVAADCPVMLLARIML